MGLSSRRNIRGEAECITTPQERAGHPSSGYNFCSVNLETFERLLTPAGQLAVAAVAERCPTDETFLADLTRLKKHYPAELAKAALETVLLRAKARAKFSRADRMYFTREALEQSSGETVSRYRAKRYTGFERVADLACGIGGDSIGLAEEHPVAAVDVDPLRLAMAAANLEAYDLRQNATFLERDLTLDPLPEAQAFFFDPGRREQGRRVFSVEDYRPPLSMIRRWWPHPPTLGVKISPGAKLDELVGYDCEVEFISERGELKEAALWFGALRRGKFRATLLPSGDTLEGERARTPPLPLGRPRSVLYEPDPAVIRAGLVEAVGARLNAVKLDEDIAYLTGESLVETPFARAYRIEESHPFQLKRLRERMRALNVGRVTVKKRGSPLEPQALIRQLKLTGSEEKTLVLTHVQGRPWVLIVKAEG